MIDRALSTSRGPAVVLRSGDRRQSRPARQPRGSKASTTQDLCRTLTDETPTPNIRHHVPSEREQAET